MNLTIDNIQYINNAVTSTTFNVYNNVDFDTEIFDDPQRHFKLYVVNNIYDYIPITSFTVNYIPTSKNVATFTCTGGLEVNKIHSLMVLVETDFAVDGIGYTFETLSFMLLDRKQTANRNNIFTQLKSINNSLQLEYMLKNQSEYELSFNPSFYNNELKNYEYDTKNTLTIRNNEIILDKLINQYFTEYNIFYDSINNRKQDAAITNRQLDSYTESYVHNLHLLFMKNMPKWLSLKGNIAYIELLVGLYCHFLGHILISVVEKKSNNCEYLITSTIPESIWNTVIKPYVHPLSWDCLYSAIDNIPIGNNFFYKDYKHSILSDWSLQTTSCLDAEGLATTHNRYALKYANIKKFMHFFGNIENYNVTTHEHNTHKSCTLKSVLDETKLSITNNRVTIDGEIYKAYKDSNISTTETQKSFWYDDVAMGNVSWRNRIILPARTYQHNIHSELKDRRNISFYFDRINQAATFKFNMPGVADEYVWRVYQGNELVATYQTQINSISITGGFLPEYRMELTIIKHGYNKSTESYGNEDWYQLPIFMVDQSFFTNIREISESYRLNNRRNSFLSTRIDRNYNSGSLPKLNDRNYSNIDNGLTVLSYNTEYNNQTLIQTTLIDDVFSDFSYIDVLSAEISAGFISDFDVPAKLIVNNNIITATYNGSGIASQYEWILYKAGIEYKRVTSYTNFIQFIDTEYTNITVKMKLILPDGQSYTSLISSEPPSVI